MSNLNSRRSTAICFGCTLVGIAILVLLATAGGCKTIARDTSPAQAELPDVSVSEPEPDFFTMPEEAPIIIQPGSIIRAPEGKRLLLIEPGSKKRRTVDGLVVPFTGVIVPYDWVKSYLPSDDTKEEIRCHDAASYSRRNETEDYSPSRKQ